MVVNFISDPWEWVPRGALTLGDEVWRTNFRKFKWRLHWLLLWYDTVRIIDTFPLFNRQMEQWFLRAHGELTTRRALDRLFRQEKAVRVTLRSKDGQPLFSTLSALDDAHVRGNSTFRWYYDGVPERNFITLLDDFLDLPRSAEADVYRAQDFRPIMRRCFDAAFDQTKEHPNFYREFRHLRELMPAGLAQKVRDLVGDDWRRSKLYTLLGYGLDQEGRVQDYGGSLGDVSEPLRMQLRRLFDWSYYHTIDASVPEQSRYPGERPPAGFYDVFPPIRAGLDLSEEAAESEWLNRVLSDHDGGAVYLQGDVKALITKFADLDIDQIDALRRLSVFSEWRALHNLAQGRGPKAVEDRDVLYQLNKQVVSCLAAIGKVLGLRIQVGTGATLIRFLNIPIAGKLVAYTVATLFLSQPVIPGLRKTVPIGAQAAVVEEIMLWFTTRVQHSGSRQKPVRVKVVGTVKTTDD